jgi:sporulation protein YlmC with PRC-barrel domain
MRRPRAGLLDGGHFSFAAAETDTGHVASRVKAPSVPDAQERSSVMTGAKPRLVPPAGRNRRRWLTGSLAILLPVGMVGAGLSLAQEPVVLAMVDVHLVALGYRVSSLLGRRVTTPEGETVGRIDDFVISNDKVLMTIISVGGFLGIGDRKIAIPYASLVVGPNRIVLPGATKQAVARLPQFQYR